MKTKRLCLDLALLSIKHYKHYSTTCFFRENAAKSKAWQKTRSPGVWYQRGPKLWCFLALLSLQGFVCLIQLFVAPEFFHSLRHAASHFVLLEKPRCHRTRDRDSGMPPGNSIPSIAIGSFVRYFSIHKFPEAWSTCRVPQNGKGKLRTLKSKIWTLCDTQGCCRRQFAKSRA